MTKFYYLFIISSFVINAQISIGNLQPNQYAELDISAFNKGILIPKLQLTSRTISSPVASSSVEMPESLLVFNTRRIMDVYPAYYYWATNKWNKIISQTDIEDLYKTWSINGNVASNSDFIGTTNSSSFIIRTNNLERINMNGDGKIVFNAPSISSSGSHITVQGIKENGTIQYLGIDENDNLYKQGISDENKSISYVDIELANVNKDYVSNFDTKINSNKYTVMIVGVQFNQVVSLVTSGTHVGKVPGTTINAFISSNTWRINLDYVGGASTNNGTWTISLMIIDNKQVNIIPEKTYNLNGTSVGNVGSNPIKL